MERLTYKNAKGEWCVKNNTQCAIASCSNNEGRYYIGEPIDRLAEFEDELENGTLLKLPCKLGDTAYWVGEYSEKEAVIEETNCYMEEFRVVGVGIDINNELFLIDEYGDEMDFDSLGENLFLTREEAEKRLEELRG